MNDIFQLFPPNIQKLMKASLQKQAHPLEEIRLRVGQPIELNFHHTYEFLYDKIFSQEDALYFIRQLSQHSLYRLENELQAGYITTKGGHRVGFSGRTVMLDDANIKVSQLTFFNIRIAKEIKDLAAPLIPYLVDGNRMMHTLILGAPQTGKTTFLRDLARQFSVNYRKKVAIIDERSEIAAAVEGVPQLDVGIRTDVMDACPKQVGMMMMIRSMSPNMIIVDEIGSKADVRAINEAMNAGVTIICSIHCNEFTELKAKKDIYSLVENKAFKRYVHLQRLENAAFHVEVLNEYGHTLHGQVVAKE